MNELLTLCFELCALHVKIHFAAFWLPEREDNSTLATSL